jgi:hypothetical protein
VRIRNGEGGLVGRGGVSGEGLWGGGELERCRASGLASGKRQQASAVQGLRRAGGDLRFEMGVWGGGQPVRREWCRSDSWEVLADLVGPDMVNSGGSYPWKFCQLQGSATRRNAPIANRIFHRILSENRLFGSQFAPHPLQYELNPT